MDTSTTSADPEDSLETLLSDWIIGTYGSPTPSNEVRRVQELLVATDVILSRYKNKSSSKLKNHPLLVVAGPPGIGKSRFLQELEDHVKSLVKDLPCNQLHVNITFGNGSPLDTSVETVARLSVAFRILFSYFLGPSNDYFLFRRSLLQQKFDLYDFQVRDAINIIVSDFKSRNNIGDQDIIVTLGVDEFQKSLLDPVRAYGSRDEFQRSYLKNVVLSVSSLLTSPPSGTFVSVVFAGTFLQPISEVINRASSHHFIHISLPLLTRGEYQSVFMEFAKDSVPPFDINNKALLIALDSTGGWPRPIEFFLRALLERNAPFERPFRLQQTPTLRDLLTNITKLLATQYPLANNDSFLQLVCHSIVEDRIAIFDQPTPNSITYGELQSNGAIFIANDDNGNQIVRLPLCFLISYSLQFFGADHNINRMMNLIMDMDHDQNWEEFVARYELLRAYSYSTLGISTPTIGHYFKNAYYSPYTMVDHLIQVTSGEHLRPPHRFPENTPKDEFSLLLTKLEQGSVISNPKGGKLDFIFKRNILDVNSGNEFKGNFILADAKFTENNIILDFNSQIVPSLNKAILLDPNGNHIVLFSTNRRLPPNINSILDVQKYGRVIIVAKGNFNYFAYPFGQLFEDPTVEQP
ncbi:hypothetical protein DFA_04786 [Cavenderia fasciculata]|uniref:Uncharacterized protein n=1 Tax=Cavenderia fasciculata TaxID=261658 RepID=F4PQJ3_CACFS|nr:uncharacterized protein DFA_04786 [Cavenderia fasciculata]EGG22656.1 hypothetical protein DFA_04786 [Cavenderia fasciculata]|eukprot:XP_004360507.1 hypothetical protein DFA_04786 [Cavenderia fasciculata]